MKKGELVLHSYFSDNSEGVKYEYVNINAAKTTNFLKFPYTSQLWKILEKFESALKQKPIEVWN